MCPYLLFIPHLISGTSVRSYNYGSHSPREQSTFSKFSSETITVSPHLCSLVKRSETTDTNPLQVPPSGMSWIKVNNTLHLIISHVTHLEGLVIVGHEGGPAPQLWFVGSIVPVCYHMQDTFPPKIRLFQHRGGPATHSR